MKKILIAFAIVAVGLVLGSCSMIDTGLVGTWTSGNTTLTFSNDGKVTGDVATLMTALSLGAAVCYEASNGTGNWWLSGLIIGTTTKTPFTYSISGTTLTTDFWYGYNINYTH